MTEDAPKGPDEELRSLLKELGVAIVAIVAFVLLLGLTFREPLTAWGESFVELFGAPGVLAIFFALDLTGFPIPHETFSGLALVGGLPFWEITLAGSVGSILGGCTGFAVTRRLGQSSWFQAVLHGRGGRARLAVERWGVWGVALGAVSPLPYTICAWAAGTFQMEWRRFVAVSLLRFPRVAFYLWLIELGLA